jgi:hypothetical protein
MDRFTKDNFPKIWRLKLDDKNRDLVNGWRINVKNKKGVCEYPYIANDGSGDTLDNFSKGRISDKIISTEEFIKFVLNQKSEPEPVEDLGYLEKLLNELANENL